MNSINSPARCGTQADGLCFPPGGVSITDTAWAALARHHLTAIDLVRRHCFADWHDMTDTDRRSNLDALRDGGRIFSSYRVGDALRVWVITEPDRACTSVLLPGEY